jgi:hypothetical protein
LKQILVVFSAVFSISFSASAAEPSMIKAYFENAKICVLMLRGGSFQHQEVSCDGKDRISLDHPDKQSVLENLSDSTSTIVGFGFKLIGCQQLEPYKEQMCIFNRD